MLLKFRRATGTLTNKLSHSSSTLHPILFRLHMGHDNVVLISVVDIGTLEQSVFKQARGVCTSGVGLQGVHCKMIHAFKQLQTAVKHWQWQHRMVCKTNILLVLAKHIDKGAWYITVLIYSMTYCKFCMEEIHMLSHWLTYLRFLRNRMRASARLEPSSGRPLTWGSRKWVSRSEYCVSWRERERERFEVYSFIALRIKLTNYLHSL